MMAELIVTKKEIGPQLKKSAGTSRARPKAPQRVVNDCRWREDMGPSIGFVGFWVWVRYWRRGSLPQYGRRLKGRAGLTRRRGHGSPKAIRMNGGRGNASRAATLASIWIAEHPCNLGGLIATEGMACLELPFDSIREPQINDGWIWPPVLLDERAMHWTVILETEH
jgi:hypothetical protein